MQTKQPKRYSYRGRRILIVLVCLLVVVGVLQDPAGWWETVSRIPLAVAKAVPWLLAVFFLIWLVVDQGAKRLVGRSLRELINDGDPRFEQNIVIAMVIALPIALLVATR